MATSREERTGSVVRSVRVSWRVDRSETSPSLRPYPGRGETHVRLGRRSQYLSIVRSGPLATEDCCCVASWRIPNLARLSRRASSHS